MVSVIFYREFRERAQFTVNRLRSQVRQLTAVATDVAWFSEWRGSGFPAARSV